MFDAELGARVCVDQVSQAPRERGVSLVNSTTACADSAAELVGVDGAGGYLSGSSDVWARGRDVGRGCLPLGGPA